MANQKWFSKKVVVLGAPSVGKSSLIGRFVYQKFSESYLSTIGVKIDKKTVSTDDYTLDMILWEVAGQEKLIESYLRGCEAVIYVVDLSRPETFEDLLVVKSKIQLLIDSAPFFAIGNKLDLVGLKEAEVIGREFGLDFMASAKTGDEVEMLFMTIANTLIEIYKNKNSL